MKKIVVLLFAFIFTTYTLFPCTNLIAGKLATTDGSTLITYSADSYMLFGALYHYPARTYPAGTMLDIYEWDTGKYLGKIAQVEKHFR